MVREFGMSESVGPLGLGESQRSPFLTPQLGTEPRPYSERMARIIDTEVTRLVTEGIERARAVIREHHEGLQRLAARLLAIEVVEEEEIAQMLGPKVERRPLHPEQETVQAPHEPGSDWPNSTPA